MIKGLKLKKCILFKILRICFEGSESRGLVSEIDNQQVHKNEYILICMNQYFLSCKIDY